MQQTPFMVFFNLVIILIIYKIMSRSLKFPYSVTQNKRNIAILLLGIFVLFSFWGMDWFHYLELYSDLKRYGEEGTHIESVYAWIAQYLSFDYLSFRLVVWGAALLLFLETVNRLSVNKHIVLCVFAVFGLIWFSYARVSLAMAMVYYGASILYRPYKYKKLSFLFGLLFVGCSFFFHKTAAFAIIVVLLVYMSEKINRKLFIAIICCSLPIVIYLIKHFLNDFMIMDSGGSDSVYDQTISFGQSYMNDDSNRNIGSGEILYNLMERVPYYLVAFQCIKILNNTTLKDVPRDMLFFMRLQLMLVIISSIFIFDFGLNTSTLDGRFLRFAAMPTTIVLAYFVEQRYHPSLTKWTFKFAFWGTFYIITYSMYIAWVKS